MKFTFRGTEYYFLKWPTKPLAKWFIAAFVIGFVTIIFVEECRGADFEIGGGAATASTFRPSEATAGVVRLGGLFFDRLEVVGRYYGDQDQSDRYWAVSGSYRASLTRWEVRPYLALGVAYATSNDILAQELNFNLAAGARWKNWLFEVHHFSNAGLKEPNKGQNDYTLSYIWEF